MCANACFVLLQDKLLLKLDESETEPAKSRDEEVSLQSTVSLYVVAERRHETRPFVS